MAAHAGPGPERHEAERLGRGGVDDFPDVEAHPLAQQRQLVYEGDVDVAEDVLEELRHFGSVRRGQGDDGGVDVLEEALRPGGGLGRQATDEARHQPARTRRIARVHSFGGEGEIEVAARDQLGLFEHVSERAGGGARERRGLQDDELTRAQRIADQRRGRQNGGQVGVLGNGDGGGHANDDHVHATEHRRIRARNREPGGHALRQPIVGDVVDGGVARVEFGDPRWVRIDARDFQSGFGESQGERQPHVAQSDDAD